MAGAVEGGAVERARHEVAVDLLLLTAPSGSLPLGQAVFEPEAIRVSQVTGGLGGPASEPVLAATSDRHVATIPVTVMLVHPSAAGTLDQAPVTVNIITASVKNALAVPVTALLAQASGGYDVEVTGPGNTRRWVPVQPGVFDGADGLVQVTGALTSGQHVVVPAS
jgi:multidrug efflux pump subunit AcrA (membrane-fusion protein)